MKLNKLKNKIKQEIEGEIKKNNEQIGEIKHSIDNMPTSFIEIFFRKKRYQEYKLQIELAKVLHRKKVNEQTRNFLNEFFSKQNSTGNDAALNKEETMKRIKELSASLENKLNDLDSLTTRNTMLKYVIRENSIMTRNLIPALIAGYVGGFSLSICIISKTLGGAFVAFEIFGFMAIALYVHIIMAYINKKILKKLNSELGESPLPNRKKDILDELKNTDTQIDDLIKDISKTKQMLQVEKMMLEELSKYGESQVSELSKEKEKNSELSMEEPLPEVYVPEEEKGFSRSRKKTK